MKSKIVIAGGNGFIGKYLQKRYEQQGYDIFIISRDKQYISWDDEDAIVEALENSEMLINMAGKSVDCRYHQKNKDAILKSRTGTTSKLGNALLKCTSPPKLWLNSSTATIYRHAEDRPMTEAEGDIGSGFSVNVATSWEKSFFDFKLSNTRQVALRMAIVIGPDGGAFQPIKMLAKFGLGGHQGNGRQMFSWIHIEDIYNIIEFVKINEAITGVINCSSPNPVTNKVFMKTVREKLGMPFGLPSPAWLLEIGAFFIRTETELILKSRWVIPEKLVQAGFAFQYPLLDEAIENILNL